MLEEKCSFDLKKKKISSVSPDTRAGKAPLFGEENFRAEYVKKTKDDFLGDFFEALKIMWCV